MGHIYIVDEKTLASEGPDAGTVLIIWYDECGRAIRSYREKAMHAAEIANLDPCYLKIVRAGIMRRLANPISGVHP